MTQTVMPTVPAAGAFSGLKSYNRAHDAEPPLLDRIAKTAMDRGGALCLLLLASPVFIVLSLLIRRDGGPVFFGHKRLGKNGQIFKCWKFRSMVPNAQDVLKDLLARDPAAKEEWERDFKLKNDPRITRIGRILRKTSLDELPQLLNILCGEMSLVGPRPIVDDERKYYGDKISHVLSVSPGITGLWQVSGRNDTSYAERVYLDGWYVDNRSLRNDLVILFRTAIVVLGRRGAY
jgi:undecaprenyl-phosphate galactose phosphotransferase